MKVLCSHEVIHFCMFCFICLSFKGHWELWC